MFWDVQIEGFLQNMEPQRGSLVLILTVRGPNVVTGHFRSAECFLHPGPPSCAQCRVCRPAGRVLLTQHILSIKAIKDSWAEQPGGS